MARTASTMVALGSAAPDFALPEIGGATVSRDDFADAPALLVMFICNHCPYVVHIADVLGAVTRGYLERGVAVVGISANDAVKYPADAPDKFEAFATQSGFSFPYLYDESQDVAMRYGAACTPDFFLYDGDGRLFYRGQFDGARPGNGVAVTGSDLTAAVDALLSGGSPPANQRPSMGCNIKWKPGNEP